MINLPDLFIRNQSLIDLMNASALNSSLSGDESFDDLMAHYESCEIEPIKDKILRLEDYLATLPQAEIPLNHYINNGIYYREITIPQGAFCTGSIYGDAHIHFLIRGDMTVLTEDGLKRVTGPCTFVSPPDMKRAGYAHEETVWAAVFRTDETDPDKAFEAIEKRAR